MVEPFSIVGIIFGLFIAAISLYKLKKQTIVQSTFTLWFIIGIIIFIISIFIPSSIFFIQDILQTEFILSAVFGIAFIFLAGLAFYLHQKVDTLNEKVIKLAAEFTTKKFFESSNNKDK